jgi:hypothetical protein
MMSKKPVDAGDICDPEDALCTLVLQKRGTLLYGTGHCSSLKAIIGKDNK